MKALLQPPLVFFVIAGAGCAILAITGLLDSFRTFLQARGSGAQNQETPGETPKLGLRFAGGVAISLLLAFIALYLLSTVVQMAPRVNQALDLVGSPAPALTYARLDVDDGSPQEALAVLRGDVVLLNLWATWCPPCRKEMPALDQLQSDLADRGLTVLHVSIEREDKLRSWLAENPMTTRHGRIDSIPFPAPALPTSLVIDREGIVRDIMVGGQSYRAFEKAVTPWL